MKILKSIVQKQERAESGATTKRKHKQQKLTSCGGAVPQEKSLNIFASAQWRSLFFMQTSFTAASNELIFILVFTHGMEHRRIASRVIKK
jgi:hypothetical protein